MTPYAGHPAVVTLAAEVVALLAGKADEAGADRVVVGLAGPPGTGKSTVAAALVTSLLASGTETALVPMDGFHLDQLELERLGRADRKGAPDTFDVGGYVALLRRLRAGDEPVVHAPRFDRDLEQSIGSAIPVPRSVRVVVTEGNYLLLEPWDLQGPVAGEAAMAAWPQVREQLDRCWFVAVDPATRVERLVARHVAHGRSPAAAREWVLRNDEVNARLVDRTRGRADGVVTWE